MNIIILDPFAWRALLEQRRLTGADRFDEVWDGVYIVSPLPNDEHQDISTAFATCFSIAISYTGLGKVRAGTNISDLQKHWKSNYRCPDVAVFLKGTKSRLANTHYVGGPDFAVEVVSRRDKSREKLDFYAKVDTRELLIVDRFPWALELYRLVDGILALVGKSTLEDPATLASDVLPLSLRLVPAEERPMIEVVHSDGVQSWLI